MLGDAYISKLYGRAKSYSVRWEHSIEQEDYAEWKAKKALKNFSKSLRSRLDKRTKKIYHSVVFYSIKDDYKKYRELFYKDKKIVTEALLLKLKPLAIAVWFMDDGNLYYNGNICHLTLSVNGFDEESKGRIIDYFKKTYDINFKRSQNAIRLTSIKEVKKFESIFKKYYHNTMMHKTLEYQKLKYKKT